MISLDPIVDRLDRLHRLAERAVAALESLATRPEPAANDSAPELWTVKQVANFLKCSTSKVYKAAEAERIHCVRDGRNLRFRPDDIRAYVENLRRRPAPVVNIKR